MSVYQNVRSGTLEAYQKFIGGNETPMPMMASILYFCWSLSYGCRFEETNLQPIADSLKRTIYYFIQVLATSEKIAMCKAYYQL